MRRVLRFLLDKQPFFGALAIRMELVEDHTRQTIATDGASLRFSPEWVLRTENEQVQATVAHCVLGCALKHHLRRGKRNYMKWQIASHMVTLPLLRDAGLTRQEGGLETSIEKAYESLPDNESEGSGASAGQGDQEELSPSDLGDKGEIMDASQKQTSQKQTSQKDGGGEEEGLSKAEVEKARRLAEKEWDEAAAQALQFAKSQGVTPGATEQMIHGGHIRGMGWREILRQFMTTCAARDYSWTRPNRRFIDSGLYLPSLLSDSIPEIVFAIDTSGSVDVPTLSRFWGEFMDAVQEVNPESVRIIQCDAKIQSNKRYDVYELPESLDVRGGGGTRFSPVFESLRADIPPTCVIYFTDLASGDFGHPPAYPVLWAVCSEDIQGSWAHPPPFGEIVEI